MTKRRIEDIIADPVKRLDRGKPKAKSAHRKAGSDLSRPAQFVGICC